MAHTYQESLEDISPAQWDKLSTLDEYPSDSFVFSAFGYDLHIRDELVAGAFASLPEQEQQILILHCVAAMADGEIGVEYMYAFISRDKGKAYVILRVLESDKAVECLKASGISLLNAEEIYGM